MQFITIIIYFFPLSMFSYHLPLNTRAKMSYKSYLFIISRFAFFLLPISFVCYVCSCLVMDGGVEKMRRRIKIFIYFYLYISLYLAYYWSVSDTSFIIVINNESDGRISDIGYDVQSAK